MSRRGGRARPAILRLALLLYLVTISIDVARKAAGLPGSSVGVVYLIVACMYLALSAGMKNRAGQTPRFLPLWLAMLTAWCVIEAVVPLIPVSMALLGWSSYVFFVPLFYVGAELMSTDHGAARTLRCVAVAGGVIGLGALLSAVLGSSAPAVLQPIVPSVGIHTVAGGNVYLAPSVFSTAEQAAEELLVALFAWAALASFPPNYPAARLGRATSAIVATLIIVGLFAAERRADIVVAIVGLGSLALLRQRAAPERVARLTVPQPTRQGWTAFAVLLGAIASAALISFLGSGKLVAFLTSGGEGIHAVLFMFDPVYPSALTGQGTGTSTQGIGILGVSTYTGFLNNQQYGGYLQGGRAFITAEGGLTKTWLELGPIGVALYAGVFLSVLGPALRSIRRLDGVGRSLTVLTVALGVVFLKGHASLDDPLLQPLFWLAAGGIWGRMPERDSPRPPAVAWVAPVSADRHPSTTATRPHLG